MSCAFVIANIIPMLLLLKCKLLKETKQSNVTCYCYCQYYSDATVFALKMLTILEMVCEIAIIIAITNTIPIANTIAITIAIATQLRSALNLHLICIKKCKFSIEFGAFLLL